MSSKEKLVSKKYNLTKDLMIACLKLKDSKPKSWFKSGKKIKVNNRMQKNYEYELTFNAGTNLTDGGCDKDDIKITYSDFKPYYSPGTMLRMGAFEGKYCNDQIFEFPHEWYSNMSKFSPEAPNPEINYFKIKSRQSLQEWKRKKWIPCAPGDKDSRGWFEWYCRYWLGRRQPNVDRIQIKRWKSFVRHSAQVKKNVPKQLDKRTKQRQALLQWSYDAKV
jgi:hypothetical protein